MGGGVAIGMCTGRARLKAVGARARAERTKNMVCMVVTLEVSKLNDWLKADALCQQKGKHRKRGDMEVGWREGVE